MALVLDAMTLVSAALAFPIPPIHFLHDIFPRLLFIFRRIAGGFRSSSSAQCAQVPLIFFSFDLPDIRDYPAPGVDILTTRSPTLTQDVWIDFALPQT
jgi:hypothetical protein